MTHIFRFFMSLLLVSMAACTQADNVTNNSTTASQAASHTTHTSKDNTESVIWHIQKVGQPDGYLIGTMHIGKIDSSLPADFQFALDKSEQLVLETQLLDEEYAAQNPKLIQQSVMLLLTNKPLSSTVGKKDALIVKRIFEESALPEMALLMQNPDAPMSVAPWAIWFHLGYTDTPQGYDFKHGIDELLLRAAKQQNKPVLGLELFEPYDMLSKLPDDAAIRGIRSYIANRDKAKRQTAEMIADYENRRVASLWANNHGQAILEDIDPQDHAIITEIVDNQILTQRNQNWLPKITQYLAQKPTLVAVGAAHLYGEKGVIELLREQGYTVTAFVLPKQ